MDKYALINHAWVDSSLAPIYLVKFPKSTTDSMLRAYFRAIEAWSVRALHPVAWVLDLSAVASVPAAQRASFAAFMRRMQAYDARYTRASALVVPNPIVRGVVTAVFWLNPPAFPHQAFAEADAALAWARDMMAKDGRAELA
jgi:hypothetical protein